MDGFHWERDKPNEDNCITVYVSTQDGSIHLYREEVWLCPDAARALAVALLRAAEYAEAHGYEFS